MSNPTNNRGSVYTPASASFKRKAFLPYATFHVTASVLVSSSERTPTSSEVLYSGSTFLLSASAAYTAGINVQTEVELYSFKYNRIHKGEPTSSQYESVDPRNYSSYDDVYSPPQIVEGPFRITTGSVNSKTTGSVRVGAGRILRIKDGENFIVTLGSTDPNSLNYNPSATVDDGSNILSVSGCTNPNSSNYNPQANIDDGSCIIYGCTDPNAFNYNSLATQDNGTCQYVTKGTFINTSKTRKQDNSYIISSKRKSSKENLITKGGVLMKRNGESYIGPFHISEKFGYVTGGAPTKTPSRFKQDSILYLRTNGNRNYIDNNESISNNLPLAYNQPINSEQLCSNCHFNQNGQCTKWNANIRNNFWCASWEPHGLLTLAGDTFRSKYPGIIQTGLSTKGNEFMLSTKKYHIGSYHIMPDGTYLTNATNNTSPKILYLKKSLKLGSNKHFTKINKTIKSRTLKQPTITTTTPTTTPTTTTTTTGYSSGGTGTSYSY